MYKSSLTNGVKQVVQPDKGESLYRSARKNLQKKYGGKRR